MSDKLDQLKEALEYLKKSMNTSSKPAPNTATIRPDAGFGSVKVIDTAPKETYGKIVRKKEAMNTSSGFAASAGTSSQNGMVVKRDTSGTNTEERSGKETPIKIMPPSHPPKMKKEEDYEEPETMKTEANGQWAINKKKS
jgi:hypothetical protein